MAIIIPSKNIYEINNQKVVDNEVDNIEVSAKRIEETKDYSVNVYNNDFDVVTYQHGAETSDIHEEYRLHTQAPTSYCAVSGVFKPFYVDIDVVVNKQIGNKIITQIKTGEDKTDETANIKYSTACIKKSAPISATYNTSESGRHDPSFANIQYTYPDDGEEGVFNLPKTITVQHNYSDISLSEITVNLNDETNLKDIGRTIKITETNDYFSFRCHLLCGEEIYELKGDAVGPPTNRSTASGTATIYIPQKISLTVYGNTIGIDLQDETIKIGNGQHVYSFSGNELMQTSNTPSIDSKYNKVIKQWKNGKEVATIKCGIDEYWENKEEEITITVKSILPYSVIYKRIEFTSDTSLRDGANFSNHATELKDAIDIYEISRKENGTYSGFVLSDETPIINKEYIGTTNWKLVIDPQTGMRPLTFQIGDMVIPYIMGADGNDKPMSFYSDKTPKWFKVIGKGIIADGQIMQELTLQEMSDGEATISIGGETGAGEGTAFVEMTVVNGEVEVGDVLIFNNETAEITQQEVGVFSGEYYVFRCSVNGEFYKNMGNTITVKVRK